LILSVFICVDRLFLRHLRSIYGTELWAMIDDSYALVVRGLKKSLREELERL